MHVETLKYHPIRFNLYVYYRKLDL